MVFTMYCVQNSVAYNDVIEHGYYAELLSHIEQNGMQSLRECIQSIIERLGFTHYSFINTSRTDLEQTNLNTLPKTLVREYHLDCLHDHDMILQRALSHPQSGFLASSIHDYLNRAPFKSVMIQCMDCIYQLNKSHGFYDFYHIPTGYPHCEGVECCYLFSVTTIGLNPYDFAARITQAQSSLLLLAEAITHMVTHNARELLPDDPPVVEKINPKPLRVLSLLANSDTTIEQIARDLSISKVTANHHLKTIRNHLSVKTNYAAIKKALLTRLITYDYGPLPTRINHPE